MSDHNPLLYVFLAIVWLVFYAPLYLPLLISFVIPRRKAWELAWALRVGWIVTLIWRHILVRDWHPVDGDVAQSIRDSGLNFQKTWGPAIVAQTVCFGIAIALLTWRYRKRKADSQPAKLLETGE